ncbi:MAG: translocation/assembly module TamB domain-containing protein [Chitinispirillaceae bacterium]|nr:translocation/assembly module TamB domain-containing protein [Chitinispirillaceae bacterium]
MQNNVNRNHNKRPEPGRRLLYVGGIILIIIVALTAFLAVLPGVPPFRQYIISIVNRKASALLSCTVTIGAVSIDLRKGLVAKNIVLSGPHHRGVPLSAERVAARIDIASLLRGRFELHSIIIAGLSGELLKTQKGLFAGPVDIGRMTAPVPENPKKTVIKPTPRVRMVYAERCTVSYIDTVTKIAVKENIASVTLEFIRADSMSFVMQAGAGHFSSPVWSGAVRSADVQGSVGPASLLFSKAEVRGDSVTLSLSGTIPLSMEKPWDLTANAEAFVAGLSCVYKNAASLKPVGKFKAQGAMTGTMARPVLKVAFTGYGLQAGHLFSDTLFLQANYSDGRLRGKARVWSPMGTADASFRADISRLFSSPVVGSYAIAASAGKVDLCHFISVQPRWRHRPVFLADAGFYAAGSGLRRLPGTLSADIRGLTGLTAAGPVNVTVRLAKNRWDLTAAKKPDFEVSGNGRYFDGGAINGSFHVQADSITRIVSIFSKENVSGSITADALISGTFRKPAVSATVQAGQCSYGRYHADTVSVYCRYADQGLQWQSLIVKRGTSAMLSDGTVSWAKRNGSVNVECKLTLDNHEAGTFSTKARFNNRSVEASVIGENLNPMVVSPWFPQAQQLPGILGVQGTIAGTSENPDIRMKFSFDHPVSSGLALTATGDCAFANSIVSITTEVVQKGSGTPLTITAYIPVALHELSKGVAALRDGALVTVSGDSVAYGGLVNAFAPSVKSQGTFGLHGTLLKANGEWGLSCSTHIVNNKLTIRRKKINAGHAVIDLHIAGPLAKPAVRFTLSGSSIKYWGNLITAYSGSGSITDNVLKLDTLHLTGSGGGADLSALVPLTLKNGFSFDKNGRISATFTAMPLSIMQPFMPDAVAINKGEISGRVVATGTAEGVPKATGTLQLRKGECYLYECDRPLGPLSVDIDFKNDSIILRRLQANCGGGRIAGSGRAVLGAKGVSAAQFVVNVRDVRLGGCYENLDLGIQNADINCTKDSLVTITVNALLADTRYTQDFSLIDLGERLKRKAPQTMRPPNPLFNNVVMRVAVNCNSNLTFDSNLGRMLIDGTATVAGRPDKPSITGQFQILDGFVYYLDRKFTVTQGAIRQYDQQRVNPSLDVTATSSVSWYPPQGGKEDYDITLLVKGDLSNPVITMSAVPSLPQPQIISLLTLGTIQTGVGTDLGSRTGSLVSQQLAGFGTRKLARFLNVESVNIYGNVFSPSEGAQFSVTKQVSSRATVTYKAGLSRLSQQMIIVSYRLLSFLYLEAETDQQAKGGIDLKFRYSH